MWWPSNSTPRDRLKRTENIMSTQKLIHECSQQHYSWNMVDMIQMPINWWGNKRKVVFAYSGILVIKRNDTSFNMDEPWQHYAKRKKPITKGHVLHDSIYMMSPEEANPNTESRLVAGGGGATGSDCWLVSLGEDGNVLELNNGDSCRTWWIY